MAQHTNRQCLEDVSRLPADCVQNKPQDKHLECRYKNTHTNKTKQVISKVNSKALITSVDHSPALRPIGTGSVQEQSKREMR